MSISLVYHFNMSAKKEKIPLAVVKKLPYKTLNRMIDKLREYLKKDGVVQEMFKEYGVDIEEIDYVPMMFGDIEVSAKTDHGIIIFNYKLLTDGDFFKDFSYGTHELTHFCQQTSGNKPTTSTDDEDYLNSPFEQEAFQNQIEYIAKSFGEEEAEEYVDNLLRHHEVKPKEKREEKKEQLMSKI